MEPTDARRSQCVDGRLTEPYLLGDLSEEEMLAFEEHYFDCPRCAEDVKTAAVLLENARQVMAQEARPASAATGGPWPPAATTRAAQGSRGTRYGWTHPVTWMAAALLLVVSGALYQSLVIVPDLRRQISATSGPKAVSWSFLSVTRSATPVIELYEGQDLIGLRLSKSADTVYPHYRCEVRDADDRVVQSAVIGSAPAGEELGLVLSASDLSAGAYAIVLWGLDSLAEPDRAEEVSRYRFSLKILD